MGAADTKKGAKKPLDPKSNGFVCVLAMKLLRDLVQAQSHLALAVGCGVLV